MLYDKRWDAKVETKQTEPWRQALLNAARLLEERGHCKGKLQDRLGRHCALGAIGAVSNQDPCEATARLKAHLGLDLLSIWNNAPERTADEVIKVMRDCATAP